MIDLNRKVFGRITAKEIIGSMPSKLELEKILADELRLLLQESKTKTDIEVRDLVTKQKEKQFEVNSRPGAMAWSQEKIQVFTEYSEKYQKDLELLISNTRNS